MDFGAFDFDLPQDAVALRPAVPRDEARLLVVDPHSPAFVEAFVRDLSRFLKGGDLLVLNDTKVLPAEVRGLRSRRVEGSAGTSPSICLTFLEPLASGTWRALAKPGRRLLPGDIVDLVTGEYRDSLSIDAKENGSVLVRGQGGVTVESIMQRHGFAPLPPYISKMRAADGRDAIDYQTVFAARHGAVAAPTAGLHFTRGLLKHLEDAGIGHVFVTLHVGAGTFLPIKDGELGSHRLHSEWCELTDEAAKSINRCKAGGGRVVAVGTTSLRVLETAAYTGGSIAPFSGKTSIFIKPGHRFRSADLLLTNFHLPKSTLFMLVCAFSGTATMRAAYAHAIAEKFRFYSYGDACLLTRANIDASVL